MLFMFCCYVEQTPAERVKAKVKLQLSESGCPSCWYRTSARKVPRVCCKDLSSTTAPHDVGSFSDIRKISDCLGAELLSETVTTFWFYCHTLLLFAQSSLQALTM